MLTADVVETEAPTVILTVSSDIGAMVATESSRYTIESVAILNDPKAAPGECLLAATNGRAVAVVNATLATLGDAKESDLVPEWVPSDFGHPASKSQARSIHLRHGPQTDLFGGTKCWVDTSEGRFIPHPEGGSFPNLCDVFAPLPKEAPVVYVTLNAARLLQLSRAINGIDATSRDEVTIAVPVEQADAAIAIRVVGDHGIGVLMSSPPVAAQGGYEHRRESLKRAMLAASIVPRAKEPLEAVAQADGEELGETASEGSPDTESEMGGKKKKAN